MQGKGGTGHTKPGFAPGSAPGSLGDLGPIPSLPKAQAPQHGGGANGSGFPTLLYQSFPEGPGNGTPKGLRKKKKKKKAAD